MWDLIVSVPDHCLSFYFEVEIPSMCINYNYVYLMGDMNARTSDKDDYSEVDDFLPEFFEGALKVVVCECQWFWEKVKPYYCFHRKAFFNSVFYDSGISFPFGMLQGLNFGLKLCFYMEISRN